MNNVPAWALRLRAARRGELWTQRDMARQLAEAADPRTRARLPERDSLIRMLKDWEKGGLHILEEIKKEAGTA